jgi:hypothetical protein
VISNHRKRLALLCATAIAVLAAPAQAASASSTYAFAVAAATATSPAGGMMGSAGDSISVTGAGTFNTVRRTVAAGGVFVHRDAAGAIVCKGLWWATGFTSFARVGRTGGTLSIVVTHRCTTMDMTMTGIPMTVTAPVGAPAGSVPGVTVADFTQPSGGGVAIW